MSRLAIEVDGVTVECDGPVEALEAVQRDAFEVRLPEHTPAEDQRVGRIVAEWVRDFRKAG